MEVYLELIRYLTLIVLLSQIPGFAKSSNACAVVTDMSPLRVPMAWANDVAAGRVMDFDNTTIIMTVTKTTTSMRTMLQ